jgi:3-oxoacyl-[acyl-carrier-protein] synthase-3
VPPRNLPRGKKTTREAASALLVASAAAFGSRKIPSEEVDAAFGMPSGKLRSRAGIHSLAYATEHESELTLGAAALREVVRAIPTGSQGLDCIVVTSETHHNYPSLAAQLHSQLCLRQDCLALDIGGACLGLLNALATAQSFLRSGQAKTVAVVTADVHSRSLTPGRVAGEFGGLFGDGASAFLLRLQNVSKNDSAYRLGQFFFGCLSQYADAISVSDSKDGGLNVQFDGEALSRAAINRMEKVISQVEVLSGIPRGLVGGFATHQPNPRLVALLSKQIKVPENLFPPVARDRGNLGSSTCGAALHSVLQVQWKHDQAARKPIFLASLGPGLLFGGGWLAPA